LNHQVIGSSGHRVIGDLRFMICDLKGSHGQFVFLRLPRTGDDVEWPQGMLSAIYKGTARAVERMELLPSAP
jgi:hypothetical protein